MGKIERSEVVNIETFILLHLIVSIILILYFYNKKKHRKTTIASSLIILIFPIGGALIVYLLYFTSLEFLSIKSKYDSPVYFENKKQNHGSIKILNVVEETRVIPIKKALIEEDILRRREVVLNIIKKDVNNYSSLINTALINDDSETSHYAASSILHSKRKLDNNMNRISELYKENIENPIVMAEYADQLVNFVNNEYVDNSAKTKYIEEAINILEKIVDEKIDLDNRHIYNLINILLKIENFKSANKYTELLMENYPSSEEKYLQVLKAFYVMNYYDKFDIALKKFISSHITFSKETVKIIRFWLGG